MTVYNVPKDFMFYCCYQGICLSCRLFENIPEISLRDVLNLKPINYDKKESTPPAMSGITGFIYYIPAKLFTPSPGTI